MHEGDRLTVDGGRLLGPHGAVVAEGTLYTTEILEEQLQYAREGLSDQIEAFADNTMTYLREEKELLLEGVGVPEVRDRDRGPARADRGPRATTTAATWTRCGPTSASTGRC